MNEDNINLEENENVSDMSDNKLREVISEKMNSLRTQALLLGAQVSARAVLDKINAFENKQGKKTCNDYKRLVKDIKHFCTVGVSRKVNNDGTITKIEDETAQN